MPEILSVELKRDLEGVYKTAGDLLNLLESKKFDNEGKETKELMEHVKKGLFEISGTLQKDIYNCDYLITKMKTTYGYDLDEKEIF